MTAGTFSKSYLKVTETVDSSKSFVKVDLHRAWISTYVFSVNLTFSAFCGLDCRVWDMVCCRGSCGFNREAVGFIAMSVGKKRQNLLERTIRFWNWYDSFTKLLTGSNGPDLTFKWLETVSFGSLKWIGFGCGNFHGQSDRAYTHNVDEVFWGKNFVRAVVKSYLHEEILKMQRYNRTRAWADLDVWARSYGIGVSAPSSCPPPYRLSLLEFVTALPKWIKEQIKNDWSNSDHSKNSNEFEKRVFLGITEE